MIPLLFLSVGILIFLIIIYILFSSRKFEKKVFRIDSDNVTWVGLTIVLFLIASVALASADWYATPARLTGFLTVVLLFYGGAYKAIRKAQKIAKEKSEKQN